MILIKKEDIQVNDFIYVYKNGWLTGKYQILWLGVTYDVDARKEIEVIVAANGKTYNRETGISADNPEEEIHAYGRLDPNIQKCVDELTPVRNDELSKVCSELENAVREVFRKHNIFTRQFRFEKSDLWRKECSVMTVQFATPYCLDLHRAIKNLYEIQNSEINYE